MQTYVRVGLNKVGLLSTDEAAFVGGEYYAINKVFYLQKMDSYWLNTPYSFTLNDARTFVIHPQGHFGVSTVHLSFGVMPVINLKSNVLYTSGDGTKSNAYLVN